MCILETRDLSCSRLGCPNIIANQGHTVEAKCPFVADEQEFGSCGAWTQQKLPGSRRSENKLNLCGDCALMKSQSDKNFYNNVGSRLTKSIEGERKRNDERRREKKEQEATLVSGAGMGMSDGQGGNLYEPSGVYFDAGMGVSAMPQELDLDDTGEGPSHGHDHGYNQRGNEGHGHRGGQGSGGWYQQ